jgi:hypothetical protein
MDRGHRNFACAHQTARWSHSRPGLDDILDRASVGIGIERSLHFILQMLLLDLGKRLRRVAEHQRHSD